MPRRVTRRSGRGAPSTEVSAPESLVVEEAPNPENEKDKADEAQEEEETENNGVKSEGDADSAANDEAASGQEEAAMDVDDSDHLDDHQVKNSEPHEKVPSATDTEASTSNFSNNDADANNDNDDNGEIDSDGQIEEEENTEGVEASTPALDVDPIYEQTLLKPIFERRDKSLKELLDSMDTFSPIIPDAVTDYYLTKSGFKTSDVRVKRLLALATQKFIADIANDAYQYSRIRAHSGNSAGGAGRGRVGPGSNSGRTVLTMESLNGVLEDYGINAKRPEFFR